MFWNAEFLNSSPSQIDVRLQSRTVKLSEILFEDDLLQELKTSNTALTTFLSKPDTVGELVDNITQITEEDCSDKSLYSKVHAAYLSCEILTSGCSHIFSELLERPELLTKIIECLVEPPSKVIPQKAALVSKLIATLHSTEAERFISHISKNIDSFSKLVDTSIHNIDISGSFEILSTFIRRASPPELRYIYCEILSKFEFVQRLIDVMTLSNCDDNQRNACQLLCDVIMIGRQEASEQTESNPIVQDMLIEFLESTQAVKLILIQMFSKTKGDQVQMNSTAIVCGIKVLQTLLEKRSAVIEIIQIMSKLYSSGATEPPKNLQEIEEAISEHLVDFHELLLNPPQQDPIKTTFGVIQKPLGYMRLEVVNLLRLLISRKSPHVIRKLVELKTLKVVIDLFIQYPWNNLLHTQVKEALCSIIGSCNNVATDNANITEKDAKDASNVHENNDSEPKDGEIDKSVAEDVVGDKNGVTGDDETKNETVDSPTATEDVPLEALLSQILNECDLVGRLIAPEICNGITKEKAQKDSDESNTLEKSFLCSEYEPKQNGIVSIMGKSEEIANSGHIIQVIMHISKHQDVDVIKKYLNEVQTKRPELYDRWKTFIAVNRDTFDRVIYPNENGLRGEDMIRRFQVDNGDEATLNNIYFAFVTDPVLPKINLNL